MSKNQLDATSRFELQQWLKKMDKDNFSGMNRIMDVVNSAATILQRPLSTNHIRNNARILGIRLPHSYKKKENRDTLLVFACTCGRKYKIIGV